MKKYMMYLFSLIAVISLAHKSLRAAVPPQEAEPEVEVKEQGAQQEVGISTEEAHAEGKQTPAEAAMSLSERRDTLLDLINEVATYQKECAIGVVICNKVIDVQKKYQDFLEQLLEKDILSDIVSFINWSSGEAESLMKSYSDQGRVIAQRIRDLQNQYEAKQALEQKNRERNTARSSDNNAARQAKPYVPSWWDRVLIALSLKNNPADIKSEIARLSKNFAKMRQEWLLCKESIDPKETEIASRTAAIRRDYERALKKFYPWAEQLRAIDSYFLNVLESLELQRKGLIQIEQWISDLDKMKTTY